MWLLSTLAGRVEIRPASVPHRGAAAAPKHSGLPQDTACSLRFDDCIVSIEAQGQDDWQPGENGLIERRHFLRAGLGAGIGAALGSCPGLAACSPSDARKSRPDSAKGVPPVWPQAKWGDVPIGGGGYITQNAVDFHTGVMWCGTDVQNCYLRRPGDLKWATVFRKDTLPSEDLVRNVETISGKRITDGLGSNMGTFAGADGKRAYSQINGWVYTLDLDPSKPLSEPGGITATRWNLPVKWMRTNQGWDRWWGPGLSGHPTHKDVCLLGTENDGAYYTLDAGKSVTRIALPSCSGGIGPAKGRERILVWQTATQSFVFVQGVGLHRSLSGPTGVFLFVEGGPKHATSLWGEADGTLWMTGDPRVANDTGDRLAQPIQTSLDAGVYRLEFGASAPIFLGNPLSKWDGYGPWHVAVDPHERNNVVAFKDQIGAVSQDRGRTWTTTSSCKMVSGGEAAWRVGNMFVGAVSFTPKRGELFFGEGFGCLLTQNYTSEIGLFGWRLTATDFSKGIEEFIVNHAVINPRTGAAWLNCWDRQIVHVVSLSEYINKPQLPVGAALSPALSMDVALDEDFYVVAGGAGTALHSWSQGGDVFTLFDPSPGHDRVFPARPTDPNQRRGGCTGAVAISKRNDIVIVQGNNWPAVETRGRFNPSTGVPDRPEDWSVIELDGSTNYHTINAYYVTRQSVSADKMRPGVFAMVVSTVDPQVRNSTNNPLGGLWVREAVGAPWVQSRKGVIGGKGEVAQFWQCHLNYVPGRSGELLYSGYIGQAHCPLVHLQADGSKETAIAGVSDVLAFGFGANAGDYPAVLFRGKYDGREAFWLTLDWFRTVQFISDLFPNNYWCSGTPTIAGDLSRDGHGKWLISTGGKGAIFAHLDSANRT